MYIAFDNELLFFFNFNNFSTALCQKETYFINVFNEFYKTLTVSRFVDLYDSRYYIVFLWSASAAKKK